MTSLSILDAFSQFGFMRRSLVACIALSLSLTPIGVFIQLRRMSLVGDAMSHAVLPGVAIGYLLSGMSLLAMSFGGFIAGLFVAVLSGYLSSRTRLTEDATFAGLYLGSLALGVTLISLRGNNIDLLHLLFGSLLAINTTSLIFIGIITTTTLVILAGCYRALVFEAFDPQFLKLQAKRYPTLINGLFMALMVMNLVAGFQILGTLMTVGLMILPAVIARCWSNSLPALLVIAALVAIISSFIGLIGSWYISIPAGPAIILVAFIFFLVSVLLGSEKGIVVHLKLNRKNAQ